MSDSLRRLFNQLDRALDHAALAEAREWRHALRLAASPVTARTAFALARPYARRLDPTARLKDVAAENGLTDDGAAYAWGIFFDLPKRRAKLACYLQVGASEDVEHDDLAATLDLRAFPFPAAESPLRRLALEGKLLHRQLVGQWKVEMRRRPDIPQGFRDSDAVLQDLVRAGLDLREEFAYSSGVRPDGRLGWQVQTRRDTYWAEL